MDWLWSGYGVVMDWLWIGYGVDGCLPDCWMIGCLLIVDWRARVW